MPEKSERPPAIEAEVVEEEEHFPPPKPVRPEPGPGDMMFNLGPGEDDYLLFRKLDIDTLRQMDPHDQRRAVIEFVTAGMSLRNVAKVLGKSEPCISQWFRNCADEMRDHLRICMGLWGLKQVGKNLQTLIWLRDNADNDETRRKAVQDIQRIARLPIDAASTLAVGNASRFKEGGTAPVLSSEDLDARATKIAGLLGQEAVKLTEKEIGHRVEPGRSTDGPQTKAPGAGTPEPAGGEKA